MEPNNKVDDDDDVVLLAIVLPRPSPLVMPTTTLTLTCCCGIMSASAATTMAAKQCSWCGDSHTDQEEEEAIPFSKQPGASSSADVTILQIIRRQDVSISIAKMMGNLDDDDDDEFLVLDRPHDVG